MKRQSLLFLLFVFLHVLSSAQAEIEARFKQLLRNGNGIPYGNNKAAGHYYNIRGIRMYAETYGKGRPLLFVHGNARSGSDFLYQVPYFSKRYKVIIADSRAQGKTVDKGDSLSYEMMADDYAALLDAMEVDSAYVVGWSDGGVNGLLLSIRHPNKVAKLAVTGANLRPDTTAVSGEIYNFTLPFYAALKNKTEKTAQEKNDWKLLRLLVEQPHIPTADLYSIRVPVLVMGGDQEIIKPEHTLLIAQSIPQSYLFIFPNAGHATPLVYKDLFNRTVVDFFEKPYRKREKFDRMF